MGSSEKILVPEWYKSQKGTKSSNAISDNTGNGSSSRRPVNDIESNKFDERGTFLRIGRPTSSRSETYSNFGRRGGKNFDDNHPNYSGSKVEGRSDIDSWRKNKERVGKNNVLSGKNVNNSSAIRPSSFKQNFPALNNMRKNEVIGTASDVTNLNKVGAENRISILAEAPKPISKSNPTGKNMVEALSQASKVQAPSEMPADTSRADELEVKRYMQLIPVTSSAHKSTALNNSEKPKHRQPVLPNKTEIPKKPQIGHLQILTRGKNGVVVPIDNGLSKDGVNGIPMISQDSPKSTPSKPDHKVGSACKRTASVAQKKRKDFFDSIRKINTNSNTADKPLSLDVNNETCDDKVEDDKEVNTVKKKLENCEINFDESNKQEVAELDEKDKVFMRSLGWVEEEVVEPLTQEEIDAFISKCTKVNANPKFLVSFDAAESSSVQSS